MTQNSLKGAFSAQRFPSSWQGQQLSTLPLRPMDLSSWLDAVCLATGTPRSEQARDPVAVIDEVLDLIDGNANPFPSNTGDNTGQTRF
jgi:hypothetical protein